MSSPFKGYFSIVVVNKGYKLKHYYSYSIIYTKALKANKLLILIVILVTNHINDFLSYLYLTKEPIIKSLFYKLYNPSYLKYIDPKRLYNSVVGKVAKFSVVYKVLYSDFIKVLRLTPTINILNKYLASSLTTISNIAYIYSILLRLLVLYYV